MGRMSDIAEVMLKSVACTIQSESFRKNAWTKANFYPRPSRCKIPFEAFISLLLKPSKRSIQVELNSFLLENKEMSNTYSKQAFSKRRQLIRPEAIKQIYQIATDAFYSHAVCKNYDGYIVTAIDGSRINLPDSEELESYFGSQSTGNTPQNQALSSCAFDVLNGLYLDAVIAPCTSSERNLAEGHIDYINDHYKFDKVLYLFDRGYPSGKLLQKLSDCGSKYLFRCDKTFLKSVEWDGSDSTVTHQFKSTEEELTFRVVRLELTNEHGESVEEILVTNLPKDSFSEEDLRELYHLRWGIETSYDFAKNAICVENFSGLSAGAIQQDYYAAMYLFNLSVGFAYDAEKQFNEEHNNKGNKYAYKQNLSVTIGTLKPMVTKMILAQSESELNQYITTITVQISKAATRIEPNRSYPRVKKHHTSKYSNSRRPIG